MSPDMSQFEIELLLTDAEAKELVGDVMDRLSTSMTRERCVPDGDFLTLHLDPDLDAAALDKPSLLGTQGVVVVAGPVPNQRNYWHWSEAALGVFRADGTEITYELARGEMPTAKVEKDQKVVEKSRPLRRDDLVQLEDVVSAVEVSAEEGRQAA